VLRPGSAEHRFERGDTATIELGPCLFPQLPDGGVVAPCIAVHARRNERVVDVTDGENAGVEPELRLGQATRIALSVQSLVMAVDELLDGEREAAELAPAA
jgi:hypothetical protein